MNSEEKNNSVFNINVIGNALARLLSVLNNDSFFLKKADYNAIVWDWNEQYPEHIDDMNERCYILTSDRNNHPVFGENICLSYKFPEARDDDSVCVGMINHDHKYRNYQNITDDKIAFYDYPYNWKKRLVSLPHEDIMYHFIDYLICYRETNNLDEIDSTLVGMLLEDYINKYILKDQSRILKKEV